MWIEDTPNTLFEEYHVASRNQGGLKHLLNAHHVHYSPRVQELVANSALHYEGYPRVLLPETRAPAVMPLEQAITTRASTREFGGSPLPATQLATLLYLANGVRRVQGDVASVEYRRNVPNSGNLGSVELYTVANNVIGVEPGIYHYDSVYHDLAQLRSGRFDKWLQERVFYQIEFASASVVLVLSAAIGRLAEKYGQRAYRLALLDAGHVSQNIYLAATALGLQVCATAGFVDDELDAALGLDGLEVATLLTVLVGPARSALRPSS